MKTWNIICEMDIDVYDVKDRMVLCEAWDNEEEASERLNEFMKMCNEQKFVRLNELMVRSVANIKGFFIQEVER
jgi:hypothetical protein